ncbi:hypothetical protein RBI13_23070 [Alcaligenaceae bacterium A4P071]|nr:hypothetical protein [Alcaligenaceae bacterium C4P045]MDQ2188069.1 hypothetical protein [Alcaligenaceae bacterium A4P071]
MNGFITPAIPLLCCGFTFLVIGMAQSNITFLSVGVGFLAAGLPLLIIGVTRKRPR